MEGLTLRQRTELHTTDPVCANCHKVLDPIGFGLENFDAIGRWRDKNGAGVAIDSAGKLPDGRAFSTPAELKRLLAEREADLARNLTERLMAHALGRQLEGYDEGRYRSVDGPNCRGRLPSEDDHHRSHR